MSIKQSQNHKQYLITLTKMSAEQRLLKACSNSINHTNPINHGSDNCDIIKAHGFELKVETKEGEGAEFIIHPAFKIKKLSFMQPFLQ